MSSDLFWTNKKCFPGNYAKGLNCEQLSAA